MYVHYVIHKIEVFIYQDLLKIDNFYKLNGKMLFYFNHFTLAVFYCFSDQKAQLMLVNIAIAADILELFELMKEDVVKRNLVLVLSVLCLWTCSLVQVSRAV